jgi:isopentenyl-diphosphate delta-isomerase
VNARTATTWLEHVHLVHQALPELDYGSVDLTTTFAGHSFGAPLFITGMTGGTPEAARINRAIAAAAGKCGAGFGLGSMRAMLENPELADTYRVRDCAPGLFVAGNIGGTQLLRYDVDRIGRAVEAVGADALCVHLNPAQELVQPEGDRDFRQVVDAIGRVVRDLKKPVIVKETGAGMSREVVTRLAGVGVGYVDVAGVGGTSWVGVETMRQGGEADPEMMAFWDWGLPTAAAIGEAAGCGVEIIASGGVRTGLDAARALAMGATLAGVAAPILNAYFSGGQAGCERAMNKMIDGIRMAVSLTGSGSIERLKQTPRVITGPLLDWMRQRKQGPANV